MRYPTPTHLYLLLLILLCTCAPALNAQAQPTDTLIIVTKLPYPEARLPYPRPQRGQTPIAQGAGNGEAGDGTLGPGAADNGTRCSGHEAINPESCITNRHQTQLSTNLLTLKEAKKGNWLKYLPRLQAGLSPTIRQDQNGNLNSTVSPTLSLGINSTLIYQAHREKQQRAATREALTQRAQLQQQTEIAQLHRLQRRLQIETDKLDLHAGVADIDRQLFNLYEKKYRNHEITPEEYLIKRKTFLTQELRNQDQLTRIQTLQYQIEDLAGCLTTPPTPSESQQITSRK